VPLLARCAAGRLCLANKRAKETSPCASFFAAPSVGPGPFSVQVPANDSYPIGLQLRVSGGGTHVKDVRIKYAHKDATGMALDVAAPSYTSWAFGYAGTIVNLDCPNQQVVTGFDLNNDVVAGPIRYLQIHCRDLQY
jgi:hypothetical protein